MASTFKSMFVAAVIVISTFTIIVYSSCHKNKSSNCGTCYNGGVCSGSSCICPTGYTGLRCEAKTCPVCYNSGACDSTTGLCKCPAGYEGSQCETVSRQKFMGNWSVFEKGSNSNASQYALSILPGTNITDVAIMNFFNYFTKPVNGTVNGDTLYIPSQALQGKTVFGKGYIYSSDTYGFNGSISMAYEIIDSATSAADDFGYLPSDLSAPSFWSK